MSRSLKKGPFIDFKLERKVLVMNESNKKSVVKTSAKAVIKAAPEPQPLFKRQK